MALGLGAAPYSARRRCCMRIAKPGARRRHRRRVDIRYGSEVTGVTLAKERLYEATRRRGGDRSLG